MAYVAVKGGGASLRGAENAFDYLRARQGTKPIDTDTIENQLRLLHSRVISEGGVYHPELASLAIKQFQGDTLEAAFALRSYRSTAPRLTETSALDTSNMRITRRISAAFKDIPNGQMLGATTDYQLRLMRMDLLDESPEAFQAIAKKWLSESDVTKESPQNSVPDSFPKVLDELRAQGLLPPEATAKTDVAPFDITREPLVFPVPRSAALSTMARAEQGSLLALAYSNMRGYGDIHPTVAEMRVGYLPVLLPHPITGEMTEVGEVEITECEVVAMYDYENEGNSQSGSTDNNKTMFTLGYGACFGHNEVKAVSMAILDRSLQKGMKHGPSNPSEDPEFVLLHIDGVDSMGFCSHYKMPHYVTFQSDMDRLRATQKKQQEVTAE